MSKKQKLHQIKKSAKGQNNWKKIKKRVKEFISRIDKEH
jgi:hypothetical protein